MINSEKTKKTFIYFIIINVAFSQGVLGLSDLAISYLYKDDFGLTPGQMSISMSLVSIPWIIKPLWGFISDTLPLFGFRRKSYLILFGFLQALCWITLSFGITSPYLGVLLLLFIQLSVAFNNVIGEALLVEINREQHHDVSENDKQSEASKNVSLFFGARSLGSFLTAYTGGLLLEYLKKEKIFLITAFFPTLLGALAIFTPEKKYGPDEQNSFCRNNNNTNVSDHPSKHELVEEEGDILLTNEKRAETGEKDSNIKKVFKFVLQPVILKPIIFIFLFLLTPSISSAMFFFFTNSLKFDPNFMGQLRLIQAFASMLGIFLYNRYLKLIPFKVVFGVSALFGACLGMCDLLLVTRKNLDLGIPDKVFSLCDSLIVMTIAEINIIPILVMASRICPKKIEGTMYALIMSTVNLGGMFSMQLGGVLTDAFGVTPDDFTNLWKLILISNSTIFLPLPILYFVKFADAQKLAEEESKKVGNEEIGVEVVSEDRKEK